MPAPVPPAQRRKLIEVSLPLQKINEESAREKSIRHGHPSTLHLWWARRPLAAARAVLFAQLVDDPSCDPRAFEIEDADEREAWVTNERARLHQLIERMVVWENSTDEALFKEAHAEILRCTDGNPPPILDPFAGGGSIPLEAQRLGLEAHASDLNPVAVLINKALIEIPPKFAGKPPVFPGAADAKLTWPRATGLAEDVRRYGEWMRSEAKKRIGHLYPDATLPDGTTAPVIAWIWVRTVTCPNPACGIEMPLASTLTLSRRGTQGVHLKPIANNTSVSWTIEKAPKPSSEATFTRTGATCIRCRSAAPLGYIRQEGKAGRLGRDLAAVIAEGSRERLYLPPTVMQKIAADVAPPAWFPEVPLPAQALGFRVQAYGAREQRDFYTHRQQHLLTTLVELLDDVELMMRHQGSVENATAVLIYLTLWIGRVANRASSQCFWNPNRGTVEQVFARNAMPMIWTSAEAGPFSNSTGNVSGQLAYLARVIDELPAKGSGKVVQRDARQRQAQTMTFSTDPPYYDNVPYAALSDFFYTWHRAALANRLPDLYTTVVTPKDSELIAEPARAGSAQLAARYFEDGLRDAFISLASKLDPTLPFTIYYAFKQAESIDGQEASTGWETMLQGLIDAGLTITATWPVRTEQTGGLREFGRNALATSVVLSCRKRAAPAPSCDRRQFLTSLRNELPEALRDLQQGAIAPVDLPQAAIGPGMAIFTRYAAVLDNDGTPMSVRAALAQINQMLDEVLTDQENDFDADTRFAVQWFREYGFGAGPYGDADNLARARGANVAALARSGVLVAHGGKVQLLGLDALPEDYDPSTDTHITAWEVVLHLTRVISTGGIPAAAALVARVPVAIDMAIAKELAYLLFAVAEDRGQTADAVAFNTLAAAWNEVLATSSGYAAPPTQLGFDDDALL